MATALVIGVTGNVGRGAAKALLKLTGDRKIGRLFVVSRKVEDAASLTESYLGADPRVVPLGADVTTAAGAAELAALVKQQHAVGGADADADAAPAAASILDHVVVSSGPWWQVAPLHELDPETFVRARSANVDAHFYAWRALAPLLRRGGGASPSYIIVNGSAKDMLPHSGLTGFCANAVHGLAQVITAQAAKLLPGVRVYNLLIAARVADDEPNALKSEVFGDVFAALSVNADETTTGAPNTLVGPVNPQDVPRFAAALAKKK
jgi:NAD(P)-dependent dehydrogenase (short-subunit alcohol dehydrogenase family)